MSEPVKVFVSHHHSPEEDAFTARLVADLIAAGAEVWVDMVGVGAADFQKRINEALANCTGLPSSSHQQPSPPNGWRWRSTPPSG